MAGIQPSASKTLPKGGSAASDGTGMAAKTVLLVDDEQDILSSLHAYFERAFPSVRLLLAQSASDGLKVLRRDAVDLIITDYRMAGMDGLDFLQQAQELAPMAPRIMITAYPDAHLAVQARVASNVSLLVTKPFDIETFGRSIAAILGLTGTVR